MLCNHKIHSESAPPTPQTLSEGTRCRWLSQMSITIDIFVR